MSASVNNVANPTIAANQTATNTTSSSTGSSSNVAAGSAPPAARSYANATKKISSPAIASTAAPPVAVGGLQGAQHGKSSSVSPVNGKNTIQPAVPAMAPPTIVSSSGVNGAPSQGDHSRKSSVTFNAPGASGYLANGQPGGPNNRASNLTFGALNASGSPSPAHSTPHQPQGANLGPHSNNPRVTSPAASPSPIPVPASSGGRPALPLQQPGIVFGGGSETTEPTVSFFLILVNSAASHYP